MFQHETQLRVRYGEVDRMDYAYYGNYAKYFEVARTEAIRAIGVTYAAMEREHGIMLPVIELKVNYKRPATYDDHLTIRTQLREWPTARITFHHEVYRAEVLLATGHVALAFVKDDTMKPTRAPAYFLDHLKACWQPLTP